VKRICACSPLLSSLLLLAVAAPVEAADVSALSDEFAGSALDPSWSALNPDAAAISVRAGALHLVATRSSLWYNASQGVLVYKLVTGDFKATIAVHARKASNPAVPPDLSIELGGVMARNPAAAPESSTFIVVGFGEQGQIVAEHKDTIDSASTFSESPWTPDAELRLCRVGSTFAVYRRHIGDASWGAPDFQTTRADLPPTLQVGPNMYAAQTAPDLDVSFDRISFAPVASFNDCAGDTPAAAVPALSPAGLLATALALALTLGAAMLGRGTRAVGRSDPPPTA
jgi:hypothetical protein